MIHYIQIENFKSIKKLGLPLERLNLFFGMNSMGKSSVIQALLLLRQSFWMSDKKMNHLYANGALVELGSGKDILCQNAENEEIRFCVMDTNGGNLDINFSCTQDVLEKDILRSTKEKNWSEIPTLFGTGFRYLGAEHIRPQKRYALANWDRYGINEFGAYGEYAVPYLAAFGEKYIVPEALCLKTGKSRHLLSQATAWMSEISPGVRISTELSKAEQDAKLLFSYEGDRLMSEPILPVNVGYGIPYVLPLVIELLVSDKDSLILIENPESHLHPKGQTMIAKLIAKAAANGAQIICESHSDHIINGIRVAIKKNGICHDDVSISYFSKNKHQETQVNHIYIDSKGNLSDYPEGLLDEWGLLMSELI